MRMWYENLRIFRHDSNITMNVVLLIIATLSYHYQFITIATTIITVPQRYRDVHVGSEDFRDGYSWPHYCFDLVEMTSMVSV